MTYPLFLAATGHRRRRGSAAAASSSAVVYGPRVAVGGTAGTRSASSGDFTTSANNQVVNNLTITGAVIVNHSNVTFNNCRIYDGSPNTNGATFNDCDIGLDACPAPGSQGSRTLIVPGFGAGGGYTLNRCHVHNADQDTLALHGTTITITDTLIDNQCMYSGDHCDMMQYYDPGSVANINIQYSAFYANPINIADHGNSCVFLADGPGAGTQYTLKNSIVSGGQYTLRLHDTGTTGGTVYTIDTVQIIKNSWDTTQGDYLLTTNSVAFNGTTGIIWTNVKFDDGTVAAFQ